MKFPMRFVTLIPLLVLGGCAAGSYCEAEQDYQTAPSIPAVQPAEGLRVQESVSALKVPSRPETAVPYGETYQDEDGDEAVRCLDRPPDMPPVASKAEENPAPVEPEPKPEPEPEQRPAWPGF